MKHCKNALQLKLGDLIECDDVVGVYVGIASDEEVAILDVICTNNPINFNYDIVMYYRLRDQRKLCMHKFASVSAFDYDNMLFSLRKQDFAILRMYADKLYYIPFSHIDSLNNQLLMILQEIFQTS